MYDKDDAISDEGIESFFEYLSHVDGAKLLNFLKRFEFAQREMDYEKVKSF